MKILVTGARDFSDVRAVNETLTRLHMEHPISQVIHPIELGASNMAATWARQHGVLTISLHVSWDRGTGWAVGMTRNGALLALKPDHILLFGTGALTELLIADARYLDIPITRYENANAPEGAKDRAVVGDKGGAC